MYMDYRNAATIAMHKKRDPRKHSWAPGTCCVAAYDGAILAMRASEARNHPTVTKHANTGLFLFR